MNRINSLRQKSTSSVASRATIPRWRYLIVSETAFLVCIEGGDRDRALLVIWSVSIADAGKGDIFINAIRFDRYS